MVFIVSPWLLALYLLGPLVVSLGAGSLSSGSPSHEPPVAMRRCDKAELGALVFCRQPLKTSGRLVEAASAWVRRQVPALGLVGAAWLRLPLQPLERVRLLRAPSSSVIPKKPKTGFVASL